MNLIIANHLDFLTPIDGKVPFYDKFVSQYSCIATATLVAQCSLMPETFDARDLDADIDNFIDNIPAAALKERKNYRAHIMAAMIDPGIIIQENENRTFSSEIFKRNAKILGMSSRNLVIRVLNMYTF